MTRRGQLLGHIVVFVIGLVVITSVLYFGYSVLKNMNEERCELKEVEFGTTLSTMLERKRDYGTQDVIQLEMPCEGIGACFIDRAAIDARATSASWDPLSINNPQGDGYTRSLTQSYDRGSPANVFILYGDGSARPLDRFDDISAPVEVGGSHNALCLDAPSGVLRLGMEGRGATVRVSVP